LILCVGGDKSVKSHHRNCHMSFLMFEVVTYCRRGMVICLMIMTVFNRF
jgi:hypothetical protein